MTVVKCPRCGKETVYEGNEFRPFCSERCKLIDLGVWADEGYSIPAENTALTEEELADIEEALQEKQDR
ncbi:MAG TPA: DNA gyrase inhibitor YacG [Pyrinomonadaceae bacterium]